MKRKFGFGVAMVLMVSLLTACGGKGNSEISVVSREDGSGTRGAFVELFGIEEKDSSGNKVDNTTQEANIANKTDVMLTTVAGDPNAIGYVSLGSLNDTVKALNINGVSPSVETIKDKSYEIARPFVIATTDKLSDVATDFMNYILSKEGQAVVEKAGYIQVSDTAQAFTSNNATGKVVVAGSSSVSPVMEKLKEAYEQVNTGANIEIQTSDSTTGVNKTIEGTCDLGMASRDLKDSEKEKLTATNIALDGIAVIVNKENTVSDLSKDQVKEIFTGATTEWTVE